MVGYRLHADVFQPLTQALASTKHCIIASLTLERPNDNVKSFNEDKLEQWNVGMRNGVERNDWTDLLMHRT